MKAYLIDVDTGEVVAEHQKEKNLLLSLLLAQKQKKLEKYAIYLYNAKTYIPAVPFLIYLLTQRA